MALRFRSLTVDSGGGMFAADLDSVTAEPEIQAGQAGEGRQLIFDILSRGSSNGRKRAFFAAVL